MASRSEDVRQGLVINVETLQRFFTQMEDTISKADQQDVVLIIGYAGTGKSTSINYFLENPLEIREIEETGDIEVHPVNPNAENTAQVGSKTRGSQTFYPETYARQGAYPLVFCDTGGLNHTGDLEENIAIYYAIRSVLLRANSIKAVVIMYKEAQLEADRACFQLARLVKEIRDYLGPEQSEYQDSLFLFFNECTKTVNQLKRKIWISKENLTKSDRLAEREAAADLSFLLEREQNIQIINPGDKGETREILLPLLHGARGIGHSYRTHVTRSFQGPYYGQLRNNAESIAGEFLRLHHMLNMQHETANVLCQDIQTLKHNIRNDERVSNSYDLSVDIDAKLATLNLQIQEIENTIAKYNEMKDGLEKNLAYQRCTCPHCNPVFERNKQQKIEYGNIINQAREKLVNLRKDRMEIMKILNDPQWTLAKEAKSRLKENYLGLEQKQNRLRQIEDRAQEIAIDLRNNYARFIALKQLSEVIPHLKEELTIKEFLENSDSLILLQSSVSDCVARGLYGLFANGSTAGHKENSILGASHDFGY